MTFADQRRTVQRGGLADKVARMRNPLIVGGLVSTVTL
jgi:hypothetical protein